MNTVRSEKDSMGAIDVPADKLWGAQTQRSLEHFRISTEKMPTSLMFRRINCILKLLFNMLCNNLG